MFRSDTRCHAYTKRNQKIPQAGKNMVMSRQLRTAAASLTTTADSSARCRMPNHARDPLIDHPAPLMALRAATTTAAPPHGR